MFLLFFVDFNSFLCSTKKYYYYFFVDWNCNFSDTRATPCWLFIARVTKKSFWNSLRHLLFWVQTSRGVYYVAHGLNHDNLLDFMISSRHWFRSKIYSQFFGVSQRHILSIIMLFVNLRFCFGGKTELFGTFFSLFYNFSQFIFLFHSYASFSSFLFHSRIFRPNFATFFLFITEIIFFLLSA